MEDQTILSMVHTRATRPDCYIVGANVINQPLSSWLHWNLGAVRSYLPETEANDTDTAGEVSARAERAEAARAVARPPDWRASLLPSWKGSSYSFSMENWAAPADRKHRWLPTGRSTWHLLDETPISRTQYDAYSSPGWWDWTVGAQQHYSLFENLEMGEMSRYRFQTWDYRDNRMGLQFVVMTGRDINLAKPVHSDDEGYFTVDMPRLLGRCK